MSRSCNSPAVVVGQRARTPGTRSQRCMSGTWPCLRIDRGLEAFVGFHPIPVRHGRMEVYGYRLGPFAYVTDTNRIPASSLELLGTRDGGKKSLDLLDRRHRQISDLLEAGESLLVGESAFVVRFVLIHGAHLSRSC